MPPCRTKRITSAALNRRADKAISTPTLAIKSTYSFLATRTMVFFAPRCFASSASSKFSLSSSVRQTTQSASVIPSSVSRSISVPSPQRTRPLLSCSDKIRQRSLSFSITFTKTPCFSNICASIRPARPAPIRSTRSSLSYVDSKFTSNFLMTSWLPTKYTLSPGSRISSP